MIVDYAAMVGPILIDPHCLFSNSNRTLSKFS